MYPNFCGLEKFETHYGVKCIKTVSKIKIETKNTQFYSGLCCMERGMQIQCQLDSTGSYCVNDYDHWANQSIRGLTQKWR